MSKITKRSYRRKKIIMGASLFGAIGLVSVGFAAWVLSAPATQEKEASLSVGLVSDKNMHFQDVSIHETGTEGDPVFSFEPASDDVSGRVRWDGANAESRSLTVDGKLTQVQNLGDIKAIITAEANTASENYPARTAEQAQEALDYAVSAGYVIAPTAYKTETLLWDEDYTVADKASYDNFVASITGESDKTMTFSYEVKFEWGSAFAGVNPSLYFDGTGNEGAGALVKQGSLEELTDGDGHFTVAGYLKDLHDHLDGIKLKLTLTANPN